MLCCLDLGTLTVTGPFSERLRILPCYNGIWHYTFLELDRWQKIVPTTEKDN